MQQPDQSEAPTKATTVKNSSAALGISVIGGKNVSPTEAATIQGVDLDSPIFDEYNKIMQNGNNNQNLNKNESPKWDLSAKKPALPR